MSTSNKNSQTAKHSLERSFQKKLKKIIFFFRSFSEKYYVLNLTATFNLKRGFSHTRNPISGKIQEKLLKHVFLISFCIIKLFRTTWYMKFFLSSMSYHILKLENIIVSKQTNIKFWIWIVDGDYLYYEIKL